MQTGALLQDFLSLAHLFHVDTLFPPPPLRQRKGGTSAVQPAAHEVQLCAVRATMEQKLMRHSQRHAPQHAAPLLLQERHLQQEHNQQGAIPRRFAAFKHVPPR